MTSRKEATFDIQMLHEPDLGVVAYPIPNLLMVKIVFLFYIWRKVFLSVEHNTDFDIIQHDCILNVTSYTKYNEIEWLPNSIGYVYPSSFVMSN